MFCYTEKVSGSLLSLAQHNVSLSASYSSSIEREKRRVFFFWTQWWYLWILWHTPYPPPPPSAVTDNYTMWKTGNSKSVWNQVGWVLQTVKPPLKTPAVRWCLIYTNHFHSRGSTTQYQGIPIPSLSPTGINHWVFYRLIPMVLRSWPHCFYADCFG